MIENENNPCTEGRKRHRYNKDGRCMFCDVLALWKLPPATGTLVKLEHVTNLIDAYDKARSELKNFLHQQHGEKFEVEDPLVDMASTYMDQLYKDHGREMFWKRHE